MAEDTVVQLANKLLHRLQLPYRLKNAEECDSSVFVQSFAKIAPLIGGQWPEEGKYDLVFDRVKGYHTQSFRSVVWRTGIYKHFPKISEIDTCSDICRYFLSN